MRKTISEIITTNAASASSTGASIARLTVPSSRLYVRAAIVFESLAAPVSSWAGNTLDCHGYMRTEAGVLIQATRDAFNNGGVGAQPLPDGIEGTTVFDEIEFQHNFTGLSTLGRWHLVATIEPDAGAHMCQDEFDRLADEFSIRVITLGAAT